MHLQPANQTIATLHLLLLPLRCFGIFLGVSRVKPDSRSKHILSEAFKGSDSELSEISDASVPMHHHLFQTKAKLSPHLEPYAGVLGTCVSVNKGDGWNGFLSTRTVEMY